MIDGWLALAVLWLTLVFFTRLPLKRETDTVRDT
jgi:hypothetical protein